MKGIVLMSCPLHIVFTDLHHTKLYPFQNLSLVFILKVFLKFCTFQPRYCYKIYSYRKKKCNSSTYTQGRTVRNNRRGGVGGGGIKYFWCMNFFSKQFRSFTLWCVKIK